MSGTSSVAGSCSSGQDNAGAFCTGACECSAGLLCAWDAGSLGTPAAGGGSATRTTWTYSTTLTAGVPLDCPGGVVDAGTIAAVEGVRGRRDSRLPLPRMSGAGCGGGSSAPCGTYGRA